MNQNITATSTIAASTPNVQEWLEARPDVQRLPVADILAAGFSAAERDYVVQHLIAEVAKADAARLTARTLIVPSTASLEWNDAEFHIIATKGKPRHASSASPTDPDRRDLNTLSVNLTNHPVQTAKVGDTWTSLPDGDWPVSEYEYIGRFRRIGTFEDADTAWTQYVIREVIR